MSMRTGLSLASLLAMTACVSSWGQTPLRKPGTQDPTTVQKSDAKAVPVKAPRDDQRRESTRGKARWAPGRASVSPHATSACTGTIRTTSADVPQFSTAAWIAHVTVLAPAGCQWKAASDQSWLTQITADVPAGSASFNVKANTTSSFVQTGHIFINDAVNGSQLASHTVSQAGKSTLTVSASSVTFGFGAPQSVNQTYCQTPASTEKIIANAPLEIQQTIGSQAANNQTLAATFQDYPPPSTNGVCSWKVTDTSDSWLTSSDIDSKPVSTDPSGTVHPHFSMPANQNALDATGYLHLVALSDSTVIREAG